MSRLGAAQISQRRPDIQGLRAIAVISVVAFHAGLPVPGGFVGVDAFFVISGFVITAMLVRERAKSGRLSFSRFYKRRFQRLTPALALTVSVTIVASVILQSPLGTQQVAAQTGLGAMFLVANLVIAKATGGYFGLDSHLNPLLNTWSLSVEEQFYLFFPALLAVGWAMGRRLRQPSRLVAGLVLLVTCGSLLLCLLPQGLLTGLVPLDALGFYSPVTRVWEFGVGGLLALATARPIERRKGAGEVVGLIGLVALFSSFWMIDETTRFPGPATLVPVLGTTLLILAGSINPHSSVARFLSLRPMVAVGDGSYSLYLWHWPVIVLAVQAFGDRGGAVAVLAAAASTIPSFLSYRYVENPLRSRALDGRRALVTMVTATYALPVAVCGGALAANSAGWWSAPVREAQAQVMPFHAAEEAGCGGVIPSTAPAGGPCVWNRAGKGPTVYLVGDSNADQFSEAVIAAGRSRNSPVRVAFSGGCRFVRFEGPCLSFVDRTLHALTRSEPGLVILATSDRAWRNPRVAMGPSLASRTTDPNAKAEYFRRGTAQVVRELQSAGHQVALVQTVPHFGNARYPYAPNRCSIWTVGANRCRQTVPEAVVRREQRLTYAALAKAARQTNATLLDLRPELCRNGGCPSKVGSLYRYRDSAHITVAESERLAPVFKALIGRMQTPIEGGLRTR